MNTSMDKSLLFLSEILMKKNNPQVTLIPRMTVLNSSSRNACLPPTPVPMPHIPPSVAEEPATAVRNRQGQALLYQTASYPLHILSDFKL